MMQLPESLQMQEDKLSDKESLRMRKIVEQLMFDVAALYGDVLQRTEVAVFEGHLAAIHRKVSRGLVLLERAEERSLREWSKKNPKVKK